MRLYEQRDKTGRIIEMYYNHSHRGRMILMLHDEENYDDLQRGETMPFNKDTVLVRIQ